MPQETETVVGLIVTAAAVVLALAVLVLVIAAVISIILYTDLTGGGKLLWVLLVLYLPILGSVAWFVVGRKGRVNELLGISGGKAHYPVPPGYPSGAAPAETAPWSGQTPPERSGEGGGTPGTGRE